MTSIFCHTEQKTEIKKPVAPRRGLLNSLILSIFNLKGNVERDPKWSQPWKTHPEIIARDSFTEDRTPKTSSGGILDFIIRIIFNVKLPEHRDIKWSKPWKTHGDIYSLPETDDEPVEIAKPSGGILDKLVKAIMGYKDVPRDPKFAVPWKTHPEFSEFETKKDAVPVKASASGGILDFLIRIIFNVKIPDERDIKWSQPWKTHENMRAHGIEKKSHDPVATPSGGILDSIIKIIMGYKELPRNPKYAKPWKTHPEFTEFGKEASSRKPVEASGGLLDSLIRIIFNVKLPEERDIKWSKPWKTHSDIINLSQPSSKDYDIVTEASGGILNSFIELIMGKPSGVRDPKYATNWKKHPEFQGKDDKPATKVESESFIGNILNRIIGCIFNVNTKTTRDSKWARPWKTHLEFLDETARSQYVEPEIDSKHSKLPEIPETDSLDDLTDTGDIHETFPPTYQKDIETSEMEETLEAGESEEGEEEIELAVDNETEDDETELDTDESEGL